MTANVASSARFDDGGLHVRLSLLACVAACCRRTLTLDASDIVDRRLASTDDIAQEIRWKIAGTAVSRRRALGWFSWIGHPGRFAWVWHTPNRRVVRFESARRRPGLIVVPLDWFDERSQGAVQSSLTNPR